VRQFPDVLSLNLGGGFKVGRMSEETSTNLGEVGGPVKTAFEEFAAETGRELLLELEPGTFLVANACSLVAKVQDITSTGEEGYRFLKLDAGMTEILRPSLYGAQHPIILLPEDLEASPRAEMEQVIVGHCCESGDLLTPTEGDPEVLATRLLPEGQVGDSCVIEGVGAYCSAMSAKNYNSFPEAPEILRREDGSFGLIRKRQLLDQILDNELIP
jgi:diaminopimelate decarboxylase